MTKISGKDFHYFSKKRDSKTKYTYLKQKSVSQFFKNFAETKTTTKKNQKVHTTATMKFSTL